MIFAAVSLSTNGEFVANAWQTYLLYIGLLIIHGLLNSVGTRFLAAMTRTFVFFNLGTVIAVIIALLIKTENKNPVRFDFSSIFSRRGD